MSHLFVFFGLLTLLEGVSLSPRATAPELPALRVTAISHYDLGRSIGGKFKDEIKTAISKNSFFNEKILSYNKTAEGARIYSDLLSAVNTSLPQYLDEVWGMADGAGIEFSVLFLWNIQFELELLLEDTTPLPSCSDLYIDDVQGETIMGHNEDGSTSDMATSYLVSAEILSLDAQMPLENFTAFCYPGELCGNAFGFNPAKNLVFSVNAVFPKKINTNAIARNFLNRAIISLPYNAIPAVLTSMRCSSGFSLNIGDLNTLSLSNIEVDPDSAVHTEYQNGTGYHFNMYLHSDADDREDLSSEHRLRRVRELPPPTSASDILSILGDTKDTDYPIYRTATPPDSGETLATGLFDLTKKIMYIYRGNPAQGSPQNTIYMTPY